MTRIEAGASEWRVKIMVRRHRPVVCALLLAVAIAPVVASPTASRLDSMETLRFSAAVALPGVTLGAGEYTFEVNHVDSGDVVRVRVGRTDRVVFAGFTTLAERPRGMQAHKSIVFGEVRSGDAPPILAWYPRNRVVGYAFDYGSDRR
jgi:hypothetical protein